MVEGEMKESQKKNGLHALSLPMKLLNLKLPAQLRWQKHLEEKRVSWVLHNAEKNEDLEEKNTI